MLFSQRLLCNLPGSGKRYHQWAFAIAVLFCATLLTAPSTASLKLCANDQYSLDGVDLKAGNASLECHFRDAVLGIISILSGYKNFQIGTIRTGLCV